MDKELKFDEKEFENYGLGILEQNMTKYELLIYSYAKHKEYRENNKIMLLLLFITNIILLLTILMILLVIYASLYI